MICGMVHEVAAAGFSDPADYEAARPSYPPDAVAWLVEQPAHRARAARRRPRGRDRQAHPAARTGRRRPDRGRAGRRHARDVPGGACPSVPMVATHRRAARVPRRVARRGDGRAGVPLVRPRPRDRRARARAAAGRSGRAGLERTRPQRRVGRPGVGNHGPRREARAVAQPRRVERQRLQRPPRASGRCTPRSSGTSRRSRPRRWSSGSRR